MIHDQTRAVSNAIGIHIRRTDCAEAIKSSPTEKFIFQMKSELQADPQVRFFLATDAPAEEQLLREAFPGKIQTYSKRTLDRNQREGIEDAVVDLYYLSRCRKVLGSCGSSFSEMAIALNRHQGLVVR